MDYGPFFTASIQAPEPANSGAGANIAQKGLLIRLDDGTNVCFDKDLLRYSAGWTGGLIDWRSIVYDGSHGTWPRIAGTQLFANPLAPGWANGEGSFADDRIKGKDGRRFGPLAHKHARWRGLHVHGKKVVLTYSVGDAAVLEQPGLVGVLGGSAFSRTLNIGKSSRNLTLQVLQRPAGKVHFLDANGQPAKAGGSIESTLAIGQLPGANANERTDKPAPTTQGLVARWQSLHGKTIANQIGERFTATVSDAATFSGPDGPAFQLNDKSRVVVTDGEKIDLGRRDWTIAAWVKTTRGGTILAKAPASGKWVPQGKSLFIRDGRLVYDIGWIGEIQSQRTVNDNLWHHAAATYRASDGHVQLFIDGRLDQTGHLRGEKDIAGHVANIGYTSPDFPSISKYTGAIADLRFYNRALSAAEVAVFGGDALPAADSLMLARVVGSRDVKWDLADEGQLRLSIPATATPCRLKLVYGDVAATGAAAFHAAVSKSGAADDLTPLTKGGPSRFPQTLTTKGKLGAEQGPLTTDTITWPADNPWKSWMRLGGFDFFKDPRRAAVGTWNGDVWIVEGLDDDLDELHWRRIATGLFQPLGVKVVDEQIYVCCRDEITRLHDLNNDGEADFYESFNNDHQVTEHFHEFAMDLQTDAEGNFYYAKSARHALDSLVPHHGTLIKVAKDGRTSEIVCNGFRAANGVGIGPDGLVSTSDQEGHWTPANRINLCRPGGFYGNMYTYHRGERPTTYDRPVVWLPKNYDRSPAEQLWVTSDKWAPLKGGLLSFSYGTGMVRYVMYEKAGELYQGASIDLPLKDFPTGIMRGRFHPQDGQLYLCGLVGWSSNKSQPGGFYRVRYTGKPLYVPVNMHATEDGVQLTFSDALDKSSAEDIDNYVVQRWNYRWTRGYGSKHYSVKDPKRTGQDEVEVLEATLSTDGRMLELELDDMKPVQQMMIEFAVKAADGTSFKRKVMATINVVGDQVIGD